MSNNTMKKCSAIILLSVLVLAGCSDNRSNPPDSRADGMVVTANPLATQAGLDVLLAGGSAVDAAVAIEAVLSLVEPQSSGLGGGAYMMHYDAQSKTLTSYDGRETAPASATPEMFLTDTGVPMGYVARKNSGLSIGVPGVVDMLSMAHEDHGNLEWSGLFDHAIDLSEGGFEISPRLHGMIRVFAPLIPDTVDEGPIDAYNYFFGEDGEPLPEGFLLKNPAYVQTLRSIAADPKNFYYGEIATAIATMTREEPRAAGMTKSDLAAYSALKREALCSPYHDMQLCGPWPSSSWIAVGEIMGLLENSPGFIDGGAEIAENWALLAIAQRLAYTDRDEYIADPEFVAVPVKGLLNPGYLEERSQALLGHENLKSITAGDPWAYQYNPQAGLAGDANREERGTSHFVVVDRQGDVVSITASVESIFGSTRMAGGMFLNNQLTDFSPFPAAMDGRPIANAVAPGKRPRSSMSPTIVLDRNGDFILATGSPGGSNIIAHVSKSLVGVLDWGLTPQQAIELPNMVVRDDVIRLEKGVASQSLIDDLEALGFTVDASQGENSGLSMIQRQPDGTLVGGVDPRREGEIASTAGTDKP